MDWKGSQVILIKGSLLQALVILVASVGDATVGALIAGVFLLINTLLTIWLTVRFTRRDFEADDYDQDKD